MAVRIAVSLLLLSIWTLAVNAHTVITYPGYRGNNLHTNGSLVETGGLGESNGTYPYGMQWAYPCEYLFNLSYISPQPSNR